MSRKTKIICLGLGTALSSALWLCADKTYQVKPDVYDQSALYNFCFSASLPGMFSALLVSSGNHGIGLGITDYRPVLDTIGVATNALLYAWLISLGWRLIVRRRTIDQRASN